MRVLMVREAPSERGGMNQSEGKHFYACWMCIKKQIILSKRKAKNQEKDTGTVDL